MNYPVWELEGSGLLIAIISIVHVFVSHFAVGGGLFLVLAEHKARRENDTGLLGYVRHHSRFFILLTLVFGAITGVGIWFAITLVNPAATSSLINTFVWAWAIEWTFFLTEIAAAMVYYYGWDRLTARAHLAVGWVYFVAAFMSLVVINGILTCMLTPGRWIETRGFWDGFFNPTYWPALVARTFGAMGLAGLYALWTAARLPDDGLQRKIARWAGLRWVVPMTILLPVSLAWYFAAAAEAGVAVGEIFGTPSASLPAILAAALQGAGTSGYPFAQRAALVTTVATMVAFVVTLGIVFLRPARYGRATASLLLVAGLLAIGGAEWVREDLRKPYVIGQYMFVNGVRLPAPAAVRQASHGVEDRFALDAVATRGVLDASLWAHVPDGWRTVATADAATRLRIERQAGRECFKLQCSACHTLDGYNAIRPLVLGKSSAALDAILGKLARPVTATGEPAGWDEPGLRLATWRGRRMPPFAGSEAERRALSVYLASLEGEPEPVVERPEAGGPGAAAFEAHCEACHSPDGDWPIAARLGGRDAAAWYDLLGRLDLVNANMPPFVGSEDERRALADYLAGLAATPSGGAP